MPNHFHSLSLGPKTDSPTQSNSASTSCFLTFWMYEALGWVNSM